MIKSDMNSIGNNKFPAKNIEIRTKSLCSFPELVCFCSREFVLWQVVLVVSGWASLLSLRFLAGVLGALQIICLGIWLSSYKCVPCPPARVAESSSSAASRASRTAPPASSASTQKGASAARLTESEQVNQGIMDDFLDRLHDRLPAALELQYTEAIRRLSDRLGDLPDGGMKLLGSATNTHQS